MSTKRTKKVERVCKSWYPSDGFPGAFMWGFSVCWKQKTLQVVGTRITRLCSISEQSWLQRNRPVKLLFDPTIGCSFFLLFISSFPSYSFLLSLQKFFFLSCFRGLYFFRPSVYLASCYFLSLYLSLFPSFIPSPFFLHFPYLFYHFTSTFFCPYFIPTTIFISFSLLYFSRSLILSLHTFVRRTVGYSSHTLAVQWTRPHVMQQWPLCGRNV
jgi:hypothetical protein